MKILFTVLGLLVCSSLSFGNESVSLESLISLLSNKSLDEVVDLSKRYSYKENDKEFIRISNSVFRIGSDNIIKGRWHYRELSKENGISIFLPVNYYYIKPKHLFNGYKVVSCPFNMASSGTDYIIFKNGNIFKHNWSCGSAGCSFSFIFTEHKNACK